VQSPSKPSNARGKVDERLACFLVFKFPFLTAFVAEMKTTKHLCQVPLDMCRREKAMAATSKEVAAVQKIVLVSFSFSNVGIFRWDRPISMIKEILEKNGFKTYLYIKVFGVDEMWAITSTEETGNFGSLEQEPIVAYVAWLEKSLPLDLVAVDKIVREQLPVGYLFFRKKGKSISLSRIENLIKKNGIPFLIGEIEHPEGFSHFAAFTVGNKDLTALSRVAHELMGRLKCKRWKCYLGVQHVWEGHGEELKEKMKIARNLLKQLGRWAGGLP
jgi:hypothetical protein